MRNMEDIMKILQWENNLDKINKPEEIEILKEAASQSILNDVINGTLQNITLSWQIAIKTTKLKMDRDILTTDQPHWKCVLKQENPTRKWFYIYLNGTTVNKHTGNYIFKIILTMHKLLFLANNYYYSILL